MFKRFVSATIMATSIGTYYHTTASAAAAAAPFMDLVHIVPYGVLGTQLTLQNQIKENAPLPDSKTVIVDPAGLYYIQNGAKGAGGAAAAIYKYLGLYGAFPEDVIGAVRKPTDAKFHGYDGGKKKVIHVVGPDLREKNAAERSSSSSTSWSEEEALFHLSAAYRNIFREYAMSGGDKLRVLPVSGGIFAGPFASKMPVLTATAMNKGFSQLSVADKAKVAKGGKNSLHLCVFCEKELKEYTDAFEGPSSKL